MVPIRPGDGEVLGAPDPDVAGTLSVGETLGLGLGVAVGVREPPGVAEILAVGEAVDAVRVGVGLGEAPRHPDRALLTAAINSLSRTA